MKKTVCRHKTYYVMEGSWTWDTFFGTTYAIEKGYEIWLFYMHGNTGLSPSGKNRV
jgi:hypothetical protein